jgi:hypothetical protein
VPVGAGLGRLVPVPLGPGVPVLRRDRKKSCCIVSENRDVSLSVEKQTFLMKILTVLLVPM